MMFRKSVIAQLTQIEQFKIFLEPLFENHARTDKNTDTAD